MKIIECIEQFISGDWGDDNCSEDSPCKVSCVRGADIVPIDNNDFQQIPTRFISQHSFDTKCLQAGDIIVEKSGGSPTQSTGRVAFISQELIDAVGPIVCSNFCVAFRVKDDWNPLYIFYYLQYIYNNGVFFNFEGKTSGLKNLQLEAAYQAVPIENIGKSEQDRIVGILDNIHRKITINRQINQNLEALAKQLYDYWFVQFDFPDKNGNPYKNSGGEMVWNEQLKREIPLNWEVKPLSGIANICRGNIITESLTVLGDVKVVAAAVTYSYLHNTANRAANVITISSSGANAGYMNFWREPIYASDCITIQCVKDIDTILSYYQLELYRDVIMKKSHGSAQPHIYPCDIECLQCICIPDDLKNKIGDFLISLNKEIANHSKEIEKLITQRDELLPLLMNGQVNSDLSVDL